VGFLLRAPWFDKELDNKFGELNLGKGAWLETTI
jgi:hypothetical protein